MAFLSTFTCTLSFAANTAKTLGKPTPAPATKGAQKVPLVKAKPKALVFKKGTPEVITPKFNPEQARGKYLAATPGSKPNQWIVRFQPIEKGLSLDSAKTMLIGLETQPGASVSPETVFRQQWDVKTQSFTLLYQPGSAKGAAEIFVRGAFTVCDSAKKACRKVLEDFRFDPSLVATSDKVRPSVSKTRRAP